MIGFIKRVLGFAMKKLGVTRPPWQSDLDYDETVFNVNLADNISAVFRAVNLIGGTSSSLPIRFFKPIGKEKDYIANYRLNRLLNVAPNPYMDGMTFRHLMSDCLCLKGNAYAEKVFLNGEIEALMPIEPWRVQPKLVNRLLRFEVQRENGGREILDSDDIFHLHVNSTNGIEGKSVVTAKARQSLDLTYNLETFGSKFFKRGVRASGYIKHPGELDEGAEKNLRDSFERAYAGPENHHRVFVLEEGAEFIKLSFTPEEAQFLGSRKFQVYEIARWFGIPPHLLYELENATYSNIEQQSLDFLAFSLRFWLSKWKAAIKRQLISPFEDIESEFDTEELLQVDTISRYQAAKIAKDGGWRNANEIRADFGYRSNGPIGDIFLYPRNYDNAENFLKGAKSETPPAQPNMPQVPDTDNEPDGQSNNMPQMQSNRNGIAHGSY